VKVSFCIVGHTHEDIDALIGTVVSHLRGKNLETFEDFRRECNEAIINEFAAIHGVDLLIGLPNYTKFFEGVNENNIKGIQKAHEFRISADKNGQGIKLHYKELVTDIGWLPRPVPVSESFKDAWVSEFQCSVKDQGYPVLIIYLCIQYYV
jgi:hypothetical protein